MSFSAQSKNELIHIRTEGRCCNRAVLSGIVRVSGTMKVVAGKGMTLVIATENPALARLVFILVKQVYRVHAELSMKERFAFSRHHIYDITVESAEPVLCDLGILTHDASGYSLQQTVPELILKKSCCRRAYLRGIYLGGGSLSDPEKSYHLELVTHSEAFAESLVSFMNAQYALGAKYTLRKQTPVVYIKESERIGDFLNIIGAHKTLLEYENIRVVKQVRNTINRVINCENANMTKTVNAAQEQTRAIKMIQEYMGLDALPDKLKAVAELRLAYQEETLQEIGELLDPPVGKSGVNHRFKKLLQLASEIEEKRGHD